MKKKKKICRLKIRNLLKPEIFFYKYSLHMDWADYIPVDERISFVIK